MCCSPENNNNVKREIVECIGAHVKHVAYLLQIGIKTATNAVQKAATK